MEREQAHILSSVGLDLLMRTSPGSGFCVISGEEHGFRSSNRCGVLNSFTVWMLKMADLFTIKLWWLFLSNEMLNIVGHFQPPSNTQRWTFFTTCNT